MIMRGLTMAFVTASALLIVGCGGGDDTASNNVDLGQPVFMVKSGLYQVSNLTAVNDGCQKKLDSTNFSTINLDNKGNTGPDAGKINFGKPIGPPDYSMTAFSQGSGMFTDLYHATTSLSVDQTLPANNCTYHIDRNNTLTVNGNNMLHVDFTEKESNANANCSAGFVPGGTCTSTYSYDISNPT
jgi:hypothetical protein